MDAALEMMFAFRQVRDLELAALKDSSLGHGDCRKAAVTFGNCVLSVRVEPWYETAAELLHLGEGVRLAALVDYQGDVARDQGDSAAARTLYEQGLAIFRELDDRWGIAGTLADLGSLARAQRDYPAAHSLFRQSIKIFQELEHKRGIARLLEYFACSAAAQLEPKRSLRLAGAAAALRQNIGAPLPPAEQAKLEAALETPRQALTDTAGTTAWLEGWALPLEKAVEEALKPEATSSLCERTEGRG
jgi:tetratricopeptide (TPR) repeat protein